MRNHNFKDLTGRRFGRLLVVGGYRYDPEKQKSFWLCRCDCGVSKEVRATSIASGQTVSCGCHKIGLLKVLNRKHGMFGTKVYKAWASMLQRCYNSNYKKYYMWGGRGIRVCDEWREFEPFYKYIGLPPEQGKWTLGRIDNEGDYEPGNVRWETPKQQANNTRKNRGR